MTTKHQEFLDKLYALCKEYNANIEAEEDFIPYTGQPSIHLLFYVDGVSIDNQSRYFP